MKQTSWGNVAEWYDGMVADSDSYQEKVILPNILRIVDPQKGQTILDVGCGQGFFTRAFGQNGAEVIGADLSSELIDIARKNSPKEIVYHVAPSDSLSFQAEKSVDAVTIILALQNIENLAGTIAEASRVLKSGGRLILVLNHPAFRIPQRSGWEWDEAKKIQFRRVDGYMSDNEIKVDMTPGETEKNKKKFTVSFHRPLQSYFKAFAKNGLMVSRLEEWISHKKSQKGPRSTAEDQARKEIPMFICLEARKS